MAHCLSSLRHRYVRWERLLKLFDAFQLNEKEKEKKKKEKKEKKEEEKEEEDGAEAEAEAEPLPFSPAVATPLAAGAFAAAVRACEETGEWETALRLVAAFESAWPCREGNGDDAAAERDDDDDDDAAAAEGGDAAGLGLFDESADEVTRVTRVVRNVASCRVVPTSRESCRCFDETRDFKMSCFDVWCLWPFLSLPSLSWWKEETHQDHRHTARCATSYLDLGPRGERGRLRARAPRLRAGRVLPAGAHGPSDDVAHKDLVP